MSRSKLMKLLILCIGVLLVSCNSEATAELQKKIDDLKDNQEAIKKQIATLSKDVKNISKGGNKNQPPKTDPNKVYNVPVGDSYTKGPDDAAITIIEWSDFQ